MPLITTENARVHTMQGVTFTAHANSNTGASQLAAWSANFAPHTPGQTHRMSHEEILHIVEGALAVEIDGEAFTAEVGDAVLVPADAAFRISNVNDQPARAWVVTTLGMTASMTADNATIIPPWAQ